MTSQPYSVQPPRIAMWLVNLFAIPDDTDAILGDLLEEYSHLAAKSGVAFARRWYWRQTLKTITHLSLLQPNRVAPWSTSAAVAGGFLTPGASHPPSPSLAIFAVLEKYHISGKSLQRLCIFRHNRDRHRTSYHVPVRGLGSRVRGQGKRDGGYDDAGSHLRCDGCRWVPWPNVTRTGDYALLWGLVWYFTDAFAVILGGAIVRTRSSAAAWRRHIDVV